MRTLHELYCILWERIKDKKRIGGLCLEIAKLGQLDKITIDEWEALIDHFESQNPSEDLHTDFTKHPSWRGFSFWWEAEEDEERKRFVQLMMELTK